MATKKQARISKKTSFGIICITKADDGPYKFLFVKKRYTYAFHKFVYGKYKPNDDALMKLFNNMTTEEKLDILGFNFLQLWYRIRLHSKHDKKQFLTLQNYFEINFMCDRGERLKRLISRSRSVDLLWELPKGRLRSKRETNICCAIREFEEETGISKKKYTLFPITETYSFVDENVLYKYIYYIAFAPYEIRPFIKYEFGDQVSEIVDAKWFELTRVDDTRIVPFLRRVLARYRRYVVAADRRAWIPKPGHKKPGTKEAQDTCETPAANEKPTAAAGADDAANDAADDAADDVATAGADDASNDASDDAANTKIDGDTNGKVDDANTAADAGLSSSNLSLKDIIESASDSELSPPVVENTNTSDDNSGFIKIQYRKKNRRRTKN